MKITGRFSRCLVVFNLVLLFLFVQLGGAVVVKDPALGNIAFAQKKAKKALKKSKKALKGVKQLTEEVEALQSQVNVLETESATQQIQIDTNTTTNTAQDTAITANTNANATQDTDISANTSGVAANAATNTTQDTAITSNTNANTTQDADISANTSGVGTNAATNTAQDTSISANTAKNVTQDTAITSNTNANATQDANISANDTDISVLQIAVNNLSELDTGDVGIVWADLLNLWRTTEVESAIYNAPDGGDFGYSWVNGILRMDKSGGSHNWSTGKIELPIGKYYLQIQYHPSTTLHGWYVYGTKSNSHNVKIGGATYPPNPVYGSVATPQVQNDLAKSLTYRGDIFSITSAGEYSVWHQTNPYGSGGYKHYILGLKIIRIE
jgi:hypothetical protein